MGMPIGTIVAATYYSGPRLELHRPRLGHSLSRLGHDLDLVWINIVLYCDVPTGTYCIVISHYPPSIRLFRQTFI